jgi:hypothetical protein
LLAAIRMGTKNTQRAEDPAAFGASKAAAAPVPAPAPAAPSAPAAPALPMDLQASIKTGSGPGKPPPAAPPPPPADYVPRAERDRASAKPKDAETKEKKKPGGGDEGAASGLPMDLQASIKQGKKAAAKSKPEKKEDEKKKAGGEGAAPGLPMDLQASIKKSKSEKAGGDASKEKQTTKKSGKFTDNWMKKSEPEPEPEPEPAAGGDTPRELLIDGVAVEFAHARFGKTKCDIDVSAVAVQPIKCDDFIGNVVDLSNNIAVAERGVITFVEKAIKMQNAGAVAALFVNTDDELFTLDGGEDDMDVAIPIVFVRARDGAALLSKPASGSWPSCKLKFSARELCADDDADQEPFDDSKKGGKLKIGGFNPFG